MMRGGVKGDILIFCPFPDLYLEDAQAQESVLDCLHLFPFSYSGLPLP